MKKQLTVISNSVEIDFRKDLERFFHRLGHYELIHIEFFFYPIKQIHIAYIIHQQLY